MGSASATTSSNTLADKFAELRAADRRALVVYVTAGHPTVEASRRLIAELPGAGADVIEIGAPFSDPLADGPTIQASSQRALENGMTLDRTLELVSAAAPAAPTVLFTYLNPLLAAGEKVFERAADAGMSGVLVTDLPVGADPDREAWIAASGLAFIRLVAPTTPPERVAEIARHSTGFVYVISRLGVTGARAELPLTIRDTVSRVRAVTGLPVCVGFGVSTPAQAVAVGAVADGVVVGSAVVDAAGRSVKEALRLVQSLREALDA
jgi:tryptophan synthase alpha chain